MFNFTMLRTAMKYTLTGVLSLLFCFFSAQVFAVSIYECEDEDGNRFFQERCPPGTTPVQEKKLLPDKKESTASLDINATLYSVPECDACQEIREFLTFRGISFTDKNVSDNLELQNELKDVAGELKVPVLVVGDTIVKGYNRTEILNALKGAGYVEPEQKPEAAAPAAGQESESEPQI
jgi:glutaredoxin